MTIGPARNLHGRDRRPLRLFRQARTPAEYLEQRVEPCPMTGCWLWTRGVDKNGYGQVQAGGRWPRVFGVTRAHQFSYVLHYGPIPAGRIICHHCDIPQCVNPAHLYAGTWESNVRDCVRRGRHRTRA